MAGWPAPGSARSGARTRIGLGLAALGRPHYINLAHAEDLGSNTTVQALEARCHAVLDAAFDGGVRYFDAARSYGRSEVFLKRWLDKRAIEPGTVTVASKWGYAYTANWDPDVVEHERKDHSAQHLEAQWPLTRAQLWEYLDIYQVHSVTMETGVLHDPSVLRRLAALRDERGLKVGLSVSGPDQADALRAALGVRMGGRPLFEVVQATINLLERAVAPALEEAHDAGLLVIVKEGLANGRLAGRDNSGRSTELQASLRAASTSFESDAISLACVLALPYVDVVLSGASRVDHMASNLRAEDVPVEVAQALWDATEAERPEDYWAFRKTFRWN